MARSSRLSHACLSGLLLTLLLAWSGCSKPPALPPPDQVYTVRGRVVSVPRADHPASELVIHHEPIPSFVHQDGHVGGMDSMEMPFTPAQGVSLSGVKPGDVVEFIFEVRWKARPFSRLTRLKQLSPETPLDFGKAKQSQGPP